MAQNDPRLTIGIATYDDFDGAWFTVQALRLYHPEALEGAEIIVLDNNPDGPAALALRKMDASIPGYRYIPEPSLPSTAVRDQLFRHARGQVVLVLDSHVLLAPGAVQAVLSYFDDETHARNLVQGPMLAQDATTAQATHWQPTWRGLMYGTWAFDERGSDASAPAFDIPMQGLGAFACRREHWAGLNPRFQGFGGEEGYLHEKFRLRGGRTVCLPGFRWLHRFERPKGTPYTVSLLNRMRNYAIGWQEVGWDPEAALTYFASELPGIEPHIERLRRELSNPALAYDGIVVMNDDDHAAAWAAMLDMLSIGGLRAERVRTAARTAGSDEHPHLAAIRNVRAALATALHRGWTSAIVLGDLFQADESTLSSLAVPERPTAATPLSPASAIQLDEPRTIGFTIAEPELSALLTRLKTVEAQPSEQELRALFAARNQ